ncbi:hypothetical protein B0H19DRAFT_1249916 [Mycena capillaripes]|nr:hypothetical protein B0H19DRAFT_1249916 [Mycena capillaripes]
MSITPSASPAPPNSFFPAPYRIPDEPPPPKRQRCSSTSRPARASSSATPDDFNNERQASAMRMFDVWSQLAEKYSRRIDEDDIVDLATGEIVKDRGVLSAETPWKFPRFADVDDAESTGTDEDDEDDVDELDAFAGTGEVSVHGWTVPPVREMDPADAKDLEEFMEAEKRRREECGEDEVSEDGGELDESQDAEEEDDTKEDPDTTDFKFLPPPDSHRVEVDDSDDELDNWGIVDESNTVSPVKTVENSGIIEILDSPSVSPIRSSNSNVTTPKSKKHVPAKNTPPSKSDRKRHPQLQLQTPPQSRTPSSVLSPVDDEFTPVPSPLSSPFPPSQSSSPTKPKRKPDVVPRRVDRSVSRVRTRSQSRGRSPPRDSTHESIPRLDLVDSQRGRSVSRRSPRFKSEENVHGTKASTTVKRIDFSSITSATSTPKKKQSPSSSKTNNLSPAPKRRGSAGRSSSRFSPEPQSHEKGKGHDTVEHRGFDRKGKGKAMDVEDLEDDDRWREDSNDPIGLPSSPTRPSRRNSSRPREKQSQSASPSFKEEHIPLPRSPEPLPRGTRKRKRKSLSCDSEDSSRPAESEGNFTSFVDEKILIIRRQASSTSFVSSPTKQKTRSSSLSAKFKAKKPLENSEGASHSESEPEPETHQSSRHHPRSQQTLPSYYPPPSFYPYPSYPPATDMHPTIPLHDPRAQFIISQAMHQLSSLFTAPWAAQPFTPPRHSSSARSAPASGSSPYSYPTTPHHPHIQPYAFDSGASAGTLPPSSPPGSSPPSSSPLHSAGRRASLVPRSRSRGRHVSFKIDRDLRDAEVDAHVDARARQQMEDSEESDNTGSPSVSRRDEKKQMVANLSDSETNAHSRISVRQIEFSNKARAGLTARAQTPGPPIAQPSPTARRRANVSPTVVKPKGKIRKTN